MLNYAYFLYKYTRPVCTKGPPHRDSSLNETVLLSTQKLFKVNIDMKTNEVFAKKNIGQILSFD